MSERRRRIIAKKAVEASDHQVSFAAICRSGHHAIIFWFAAQVSNQYNPIVAVAPRPYIVKHKRIHKIYGNELGCNPHIFICNYESGFPLHEPPRVEILQFSNHIPVIIVNRDLLNWHASWRKWGIDWDDKFFIEWERNIKQSIGYTNHIPNTPFIDVKYNKWVSSKEYRKNIFYKICELMGIEKGTYKFTDDGRNKVTKIGNGSSFDRNKYDGRATEMKVLERYKTLTNKQINNIPIRLKKLNREYFGDDLPYNY